MQKMSPSEKNEFFDYSRVDWRFVARIMEENSRRLSRSRKGESDTGTSKEKLPLLLMGDTLKRRVKENEERVCQYIFETGGRFSPKNGRQVEEILFSIADMTNDGLLPAGRLRTWPIRAFQPSVHGDQPISGPEEKVAPQNLEAAITSFCETVWQRWTELSSDPAPLAAWAEWELNGGALHPFYDGCGRISRSFGAMLLIRGSILLPLYDETRLYFEHGNRGLDAFVFYMARRIHKCSEWIGHWGTEHL